MKKVGIIIGVIVVIIVITLVILLKQSIKKDQEQTKKNMNEITTEYNTFTQNVTLFNERREELAEVLSNNKIYYANLYKNSETIKNKIQNCEDVVTKIKSKNEKIEKLCEKYYPNEEINNKCEEYKKSYTKIFEVIKQDVDNYNQMVTKYNEWTKTNPKYKPIEKYQLKEVNNG